MHRETTFLNVDLEVLAREDLTTLANALESHLFVLDVQRIGRRYRASFEVLQPKTPDTAIRRLVAAIQRLPPRRRAQWNRAARRDFNIGIQAALEPPSREFPIEAATVNMVAKVGGRIVVTVYGASQAAE